VPFLGLNGLILLLELKSDLALAREKCVSKKWLRHSSKWWPYLSVHMHVAFSIVISYLGMFYSLPNREIPFFELV